MLSTIHYVWAFLLCLGIHHDHFLTSFFSWNSTDSLDGTGKLLCSCLQSPGFVFSVLNKYYEQDVTPIHPSFPLPAVGTEDTYRECSAMHGLPLFLSECKCLWWQCSCRYNDTASHGLSLSFPLLQERRSAHHHLCCDSMASSHWSISFVLFGCQSKWSNTSDTMVPPKISNLHLH